MYIEALINPIAYLSEQEKHSQQLAVLEDAEFVSLSVCVLCEMNIVERMGQRNSKLT